VLASRKPGHSVRSGAQEQGQETLSYILGRLAEEGFKGGIWPDESLEDVVSASKRDGSVIIHIDCSTSRCRIYVEDASVYGPHAYEQAEIEFSNDLTLKENVDAVLDTARALAKLVAQRAAAHKPVHEPLQQLLPDYAVKLESWAKSAEKRIGPAATTLGTATAAVEVSVTNDGTANVKTVVTVTSVRSEEDLKKVAELARAMEGLVTRFLNEHSEKQ